MVNNELWAMNHQGRSASWTVEWNKTQKLVDANSFNQASKYPSVFLVIFFESKQGPIQGKIEITNTKRLNRYAKTKIKAETVAFITSRDRPSIRFGNDEKCD